MKKFAFVSGLAKESVELAKSINTMLEKGWELHGGPVVVYDAEQKAHVFYQALVK